MQFLAAYVLKGRMQAVLVVVVAAIMALLLPPISYLSGAALALVTLRHGLQAGLQLALLATAALVALLLLLQLPLQLSGVILLVLWLPVWALSVSLRRTASPQRAVGLALLFGVMLLLGFYLAIDNPQQWWSSLLRQIMEPMTRELPPGELAQVEDNIRELAAQMSGVMAASLVASLLGCLFLGRWWQALMFNPGGFGTEFRCLRLGRSLALVALLMALGQLLWQLQGDTGGMLRDLLALLQVGFALQGVAIVHALSQAQQVHRGWLVAMYIMLLLFTGPLLLLLAMAGVADNWFDFRGRYGRGKQAGNE